MAIDANGMVVPGGFTEYPPAISNLGGQIATTVEAVSLSPQKYLSGVVAVAVAGVHTCVKYVAQRATSAQTFTVYYSDPRVCDTFYLAPYAGAGTIDTQQADIRDRIEILMLARSNIQIESRSRRDRLRAMYHEYMSSINACSMRMVDWYNAQWPGLRTMGYEDIRIDALSDIIRQEHSVEYYVNLISQRGDYYTDIWTSNIDGITYGTLTNRFQRLIDSNPMNNIAAAQSTAFYRARASARVKYSAIMNYVNALDVAWRIELEDAYVHTLYRYGGDMMSNYSYPLSIRPLLPEMPADLLALMRDNSNRAVPTVAQWMSLYWRTSPAVIATSTNAFALSLLLKGPAAVHYTGVLELRLFTSRVGEVFTAVPIGSQTPGYAPARLGPSDWVLTDNVIALQSLIRFRATGDWVCGAVRGYYVVFSRTPEVVLFYQDDAPNRMEEGSFCNVNLSVAVI